MKEIFIQVTVLILAVFTVRKLVGTKMHVYIRYGLWLVVALRLIFPVNVAESSISFLNVYERIIAEYRKDSFDMIWQEENRKVMQDYSKKTSASEKIENGNTKNVTDYMDSNAENSAEVVILQESENGNEQRAESKQRRSDFPIFLKNVYYFVWMCGSLVTGSVLAIQHFIFIKRLKRAGKRVINTQYDIPVYVVKFLESPCLAGVFKPAIYIREEIPEKEEYVQYAVTHELVHYRHKDYLWAVVRAVCVSLWWFHPLVWAAAKASVRDGELACDKGTISVIGEENRFSYGEMLVEMAAGRKKKRNYAYGVLLQPRKTEIKERITMLAEGQKNKAVVTIFSILFMLGITGCSFTGGSVDKDEKLQFEEVGVTEDKIAKIQEDLKKEYECELVPKRAELDYDTPFGAEGPTLDYAGNYGNSERTILIFHDYFGLIVYDLDAQRILQSLDLAEIGCDTTQGENACQVAVSKDGTIVWLHPMTENYLYRYEVKNDKLFQVFFTNVQGEEKELTAESFQNILEKEECFENYAMIEYNGDYVGWYSNYLYYGYGAYIEYIHLYAPPYETMTLGTLQCVWSDMVYILFPVEEIALSVDGKFVDPMNYFEAGSTNGD